MQNFETGLKKVRRFSTACTCGWKSPTENQRVLGVVFKDRTNWINFAIPNYKLNCRIIYITCLFDYFREHGVVPRQ